MSIIKLNAADLNTRIENFLDSLPELEALPAQELQQYREQTEELIALLDEKEPRSMNSEAYEEWADRHEELEDVLDEILDLQEQ